MDLGTKFRALYSAGQLDLPLPGSGHTSMRHRRLTEIARADLSLARLAEAHTDALAILAEAGRRPLPGLYGVWAAESAGGGVRLDRTSGRKSLTGTKMFCSGAGIVDRALITISTPEPRLMDVSFRDFPETIEIDESTWKSSAFADTQTATVSFTKTPVCLETLMGGENWYVERPGFWHGACGPAACWAGGAIALVDYALSQSRRDPHTMAHLGGMCAAAWGLWALLDQAGEQIDCSPADVMKAKLRALSLRHLVEQACADILTRLGRAYGPRPLAFDRVTSQRCAELNLYIRQSHAERDLEVLGSLQFASHTNIGEMTNELTLSPSIG